MENLGVLFGEPHEIKKWESIYRSTNNTVYKRRESTVWVDEGTGYLVPLKFEAWYERRALIYRGPIIGMDIDVQSEDEFGAVELVTFGGEVINPEPMDEEEPEEDWSMEIDGHEYDPHDIAELADEPEYVEPVESDPEELPSSEDSGAETD